MRAADELRGSGKGGGELRPGGEKVGRKQALDQLTRVFLPDAGVRSAGAPNEISEVCPSIEELDLEGNLLESWEPVVAIAVQLPQLHWLGLNRLALAPLAALPDGFARGLGARAPLRALCLNATRLESAAPAASSSRRRCRSSPSSDARATATALTSPRVEGDASDAAAAADPPPLWRLRTLFLEDNALDAWASLAPLAALARCSSASTSTATGSRRCRRRPTASARCATLDAPRQRDRRVGVGRRARPAAAAPRAHASTAAARRRARAASRGGRRSAASAA